MFCVKNPAGEGKKSQIRTSSTRKLSHPSKTLRRSSTKPNVGVLSSCQLLRDHLSICPIRLVYHQPPLSPMFQEEETHRGHGYGLPRPLLRGVRRAGLHPSAAQLGSTLLKCGIMGELCRPGERAGLFLGMRACVSGPRLSVKSNLTASSNLAVLNHTSGAHSRVLSTWLRRRHTRPYV